MTEKGNEGAENELRETFFGILTYDVLLAAERLNTDDSQAARRDFIRTLFAAVEGYVWEFRQHVRSIADDINELPSMLAMALDEVSYSVDENGRLLEQKRYISLPSMIRLVTRIAEEICPDLRVDFNGSGWTDLKRTIVIRNRITHPKSMADLNITSDDTKTAWAGLIWLLEHVTAILQATIVAQADFLIRLKIIVGKLKAGDPVATDLYRATFSEPYE